MITMESTEGILTDAFGDYPITRVLDFLIYSRDFDYPLTEIAANANVNFVTLKKIWQRLEASHFVIQTRKIGNARLYKLNEQNPVVQKLIELNKELGMRAIQEMGKKGKRSEISATVPIPT